PVLQHDRVVLGAGDRGRQGLCPVVEVEGDEVRDLFALDRRNLQELPGPDLDGDALAGTELTRFDGHSAQQELTHAIPFCTKSLHRLRPLPQVARGYFNASPVHAPLTRHSRVRYDFD